MTSNVSELAQSWYRVSGRDTHLEQGDQLFNFPLLFAARDGDRRPMTLEMSTDLIILTQSCDLHHSKVGTILTAPVARLSDWIIENPFDLERLEEIRQGFDASLYLLPAWIDGPYERVRQDRVVDFSVLHSVALSDMEGALAGGNERIALGSPAREHFSQAVARSFMRVGLPIDIPSFRLHRSGSEKRTLEFLPFQGNEDLIGERRCALARPLSVTLHMRKRMATDETFHRLITTGQPAVEGAGYTPEHAAQSLARQLVRRWMEDDDRWAWVHDILTIGS